jgi:hypothetical protein
MGDSPMRLGSRGSAAPGGEDAVPQGLKRRMRGFKIFLRDSLITSAWTPLNGSDELDAFALP